MPHGKRISIPGKTSELQARRASILDLLPNDDFVRPMDIGGTDASHHSGDLKALVNAGLVERKRFYIGLSSGHYRYRRK